MMMFKATILALATGLILLLLLPTTFTLAQSPFTITPPPAKTPLVPPPAAQQQILESSNYATEMINELNHRLGNNTSIAHAAQVLKQMTAEGKISCPAPFSNLGHCLLTPPGAIEELPVPPLAPGK